MSRRHATLAALVALLALAPAAMAAPSSGRYAGKLFSFDRSDKTPYKGTKVSFKAGGGKVSKFSVSIAPVYCVDVFDFTNSGIQLTTIYVPSAKIKGSRFSREYKVKDKDGSLLGTVTLKGAFRGASRASGTIKTQYSNCSGTFRWSAKRK
jgi:hypothetical protein